MRKSKFTEAQIVAILAQYEQGIKVTDICREHGISQPTFYQWQRKYSGMEISELKRLREMEQELAQFKRIVADLTLQNRVLKDVIEKKL
jgi:putative transposase